MGRNVAPILVTVAFLSACDGYMTIRGETPAQTSCELTLTDRQSVRVANTFTVSGNFSQGLFFPGTWRAPPMTLTALCGGTIAKTIENPSLGVVDLGKLRSQSASSAE